MSFRYEHKVWGNVIHVFDSPECGVSVLFTNTGAWCSRHYHVDRLNRFIVATGAIDVVSYSQDGTREHRRSKLSSGGVFDMPAGEVHSFEVKEGGVVVEVYLPARPGATVRSDDITRLQPGGKTC